MKCFTAYNWADPSSLLQLNTTALSPLLDLVTAHASSSVVPAVRIPLTASSWLGVRTTASGGNIGRFFLLFALSPPVLT